MFYVSIYGQNLTKADSTNLLDTWNNTSKLILSKDTLKLRGLCLDSIDCTLCVNFNDTVTGYTQSIDFFLKNCLVKLIDNKKLWAIISTEKPDIYMSSYTDKLGHEETTYGLAYTIYKPNELGKRHEGMQVIFDYVKRQKNFKLTSISTVP